MVKINPNVSISKIDYSIYKQRLTGGMSQKCNKNNETKQNKTK